MTKQERLDKTRREESDSKPLRKEKYSKSGRNININRADFKSEPLWSLLLETARNNPLHAGNVGYVKEYILPFNPKIDAKELATKLSITVGEALAILDRLLPEK